MNIRHHFQTTMKLTFLILLGIIFLPAVHAQDDKEEENPLAQFAWVFEGEGKLGSIAEIKIPEGFGFLDGDETRKLMTAMGNLNTNMEVGTLMQMEEGWFVVFEFDEVGYVNDDEKDDLDADDMLEQKQASQKAGNEYREEQGLEPMFIDGWVKPPFYNPDTNNLEWGLKIRVEDSYNVNYISKLLGRKGVMDATLVCGTEEMESILPVFQGLLGSYEYADGQKYAEYTSGDKIAKYGLTALVVGAGATIAAKAGLFAKFWKFIVAGVVAVIAGAKRLFGRGTE